jgi:hypothetical protein
MGRRCTVLLLAALAAAAVAVPAAAAPRSTFVQATLVGDGDPDGSGSAVLEFGRNKNVGFVCHQLEVEDVARPIRNGAVTIGESGEIVARLFVTIGSEQLEACSFLGTSHRREIKQLSKDPSGFFLHLYNDEFPCDVLAVSSCPPGALIGQLEPLG